MGIYPWLMPPLNEAYGPLPAGFQLTVAPGYSSVVGPNNIGKSAILQAAFKVAMNDSNVGPQRVCYLPSDRIVVAGTTEVGGRSLENYNRDLLPYLQNGPLNYENFPGPNRNELFRVLLNHSDFMDQSQKVQELLEVLGLPKMTLRQAQTLHFDMVLSGVQGSGVRAILPILAALTDSDLRLLLIDEPETSLEPALQKALRDLLIDKATEERPIVVATHSHLFLNRSRPESVISMSRSKEGITVKPLGSGDDIVDVTFNLLGNSLEDLYFPGNFLIVEGSSDQRIVGRVLELLDVPNSTVKVIASRGIDRVRSTISSIELALMPLLASSSPYSTRVTALIDHPTDPSKTDALRAGLGDRLYILDQPSLEEYLAEHLYERVGLDKQAVLEELRVAQGHAAKGAVKQRVSDAIAKGLEVGDLESLETIRAAAQRSADLA